MTTTQQIDALISMVEKAVEDGLSYFEGPGAESNVKIDLWTPREVLCHMIYWHQLTVEGMEAAVSGNSPQQIHASTDEMNARAVGRASGKSIAKLADEVRGLQARLSKAAREMPDPNVTVLIRSDNSESTGLQRLELITKHWNGHIEELKG